jgi:hypothetical protein
MPLNPKPCPTYVIKHTGYVPLGIRLDSGDLGSLSTKARAKLREAAAKYQEVFPCPTYVINP